MIRFVICMVGLFLAGCAFEDAVKYGNGLFGVVPPLPSAILAVGAAIGWAMMAVDAGNHP